MSKGETPLRAVRVDDPLWEAAQARAKENGDNLSAIIRDALRQYIDRSKPLARQEPPAHLHLLYKRLTELSKDDGKSQE